MANDITKKYEEIIRNVMLLSDEVKDKTERKLLLGIYNNTFIGLAKHDCKFSYEDVNGETMIHIYTENNGHYTSKKVSIEKKLKDEYNLVFSSDKEVPLNSDEEEDEDEDDLDMLTSANSEIEEESDDEVPMPVMEVAEEDEDDIPNPNTEITDDAETKETEKTEEIPSEKKAPHSYVKTYSSIKDMQSFYYDEYEITLLEKETQETSIFVARIYPMDIQHTQDGYIKIALAIGYDGDYKMMITDDENGSVKMCVNGVDFISSGKYENGEFISRLSTRFDKRLFECNTNMKVVRPKKETFESHLVMMLHNEECHIFPMESTNGRVDGLVSFLMYKNDEIYCPNQAKTVIVEQEGKKYEVLAYYMEDGLHIDAPE